VVEFSSEDPDYPAEQLNEITPTTKGWQSVRFCSYTQELGFQFVDGESHVTQIQLLSHQCKIPSKVEIYVGKGSSYSTASFKRLGYLSLDSNERSNYQARELKTVFVDAMGSYLKLLIFENYVNKHNSYNQVGVVAISLLGLDDDSKRPVGGGRGEKDSAKGYNNPYNDLTVDINLDPQTANKLRQLAEAKAKAISNEDYVTAKQIKLVEQELKSLGSRLAQLDMAKQEAVATEDYDLAKEIKEECDNLRQEIEQRIRSINIPGVVLSSSAAPRKVTKYESDERESELRVTPRDVDSIPVGGNKNKPASPRVDDYHNAGKKAVRVETMEEPSSFQSSSPPLKGAGQYSYPEPEDNTDPMNRPIRPKGPPVYDEKDMYGEDGPPAEAGTGMPTEVFPPGQHPLDGAPGFMDLPTPELLSSKSR
jgi:hypothetical protein